MVELDTQKAKAPAAKTHATNGKHTKIPNFFIIGAPRCGTTWLYEYLRKHPKVFMPDVKEPHFQGFCRDLKFANGVADLPAYLDLFKPAPQAALTGEASVFYLSSQTAADRIFEFNPKAKIIAILRNPIEMIYSNHRKNITLGLETEYDFKTALDLEESRTKAFDSPVLDQIPADSFKLRYRHNAGFAEQIERYRVRFGRDQVHVILFDDIASSPASVNSDVCRFLGIEPSGQESFEKINQNLEIRSKLLMELLRGRYQPFKPTVQRFVPRAARDRVYSWLWSQNLTPKRPDPIPEDVRHRLAEEMRPGINRLRKLLGRDLSHWCR